MASESRAAGIIDIKRDKAGEIKTFICENIKQGHYQDRLPSLNQLADHFKVNIKTAKRAISILEKDGLVVSHKGKGTFVNKNYLTPSIILFIGREDKEISMTLSSVLTTSIESLELNYVPNIYLLPQKLKNRKYDIPTIPGLAGILIEDALLEHINRPQHNMPVIQLHCAGLNGVPAIRPNVEDGIKQVVAYLKSLGHKKVAYLGPESDLNNTLDDLKRNSFYQYISKQNMETDESWNLPAYYRVTAGYQAARTVLSQQKRPTAFVCVNDEVALGVLNACEELGLSVPSDISVVGFDDRAPAVMRKPFLSTVNVNFREIATEGIKLLHKFKQNPVDAVADIPSPLPVHLVIRETTGAVK